MQNDRRKHRNGSGHALAERASRGAMQQVKRAAEHNQRAQVANAHLSRGEQLINNVGRQYAGQSDPQLGGRVAEAAHASTFNADAAMKARSDLSARTTAQVGRCHDAADLEVLKANEVVSRAQVKYFKKGSATAKQLSHPKYQGHQKVGPSDQLKQIRATAKKEALRNAGKRPQQAAQYEETARTASAQVKLEGVKSKPLTRKGAVDLAKNARKGRARLDRVPKRSVSGHVGKAAQQAAVAGGAVAGGLTAVFSGATNVSAAFEGKISAGEALKRTAVDTSVAALDGSAKAAAGAAIKASAAAAAKSAGNQAARSVLGSVARSNVAFAAGAVAVDTVVGAVKFAKGDVSGAEFAKSVGESASGATGGWGGAAGGAALGTMLCPGVGTVVGGVLGGISGAIGATSLFKAIFDDD